MDKKWETARTTTNKQTYTDWLIELTDLWPPVKNLVIGGVPVVGGASGG